MPCILQICNLLQQEVNSSLHRNIFILAGDSVWQKNSLKEILSNHEDSTLWVGENNPLDFPFVEVKKAHTWLGKEKRVVIFDANKDFNPDSFAAISGIVIGGGLFFLLLPEENLWNNIYTTRFGKRLIQSIKQDKKITIIRQFNKNFITRVDNKQAHIDNDFYSPSPFFTLDQQHCVEAIEQHVTDYIPIVLVSDRGRGKSASLGIAAARLLQSGIKNIVITAPRLSATDVIFKHISESLLDAEVTKGRVKWNDAVIQFYAPDYLLQNYIEAEVLLIDEAAAIPVPILTSFLYRYPQCIFATTVHGYEGTGRGFSLRFYKELDKKNENWLQLKMTTPIRWAENDPLENWMFNLLCLNAEVSDASKLLDVDVHGIENKLLNKEELENNTLLNDVFSLLVLAHYRTRPKDLKSLLDDDNISVYASFYKKSIVAVALVIREGSFSELLSTEVYQGKRRLHGHLLAQALSYHCGIENAAILDYARIMRIAVHPALQNKGIGTQLIDFIIRSEKKKGRDAIGTSFGMNKSLLNFWHESKFNVVRIGFTREQTSGEHAAVMLLPLSEKGQKLNQAARERFIEQLPYWFDDVLKDIPLEIKNCFHINKIKTKKLTEIDIKELNSFKLYSRNYELCIAALNKLVMIKREDIARVNFNDDFRRILNKKVINKIHWKIIGKEMKLHSQNKARELFHSAIVYLMRF